VNVFQRKTSGSVVCPSCGSLVGVNDAQCYICGRRNPSLWGFSPLLKGLGADFGFVPLVVGTCTVVYLLTLLMTLRAAGPGAVTGGGLSFLGPGGRELLRFGASGAFPVFVLGNWWTPLSASWLHAGLLHILFNMMGVRVIGPLTADVIGPARTVIIYVIAGVCGFLLTSVWAAFLPPLPLLGGGAPTTVGASASMCGLIGALFHYGRRGGSSVIHSQATQWALMTLLYGVLMGGTIDNFAHIGGFVGGYAVSAVFNPLTRERGDHAIMAVVCLAASLLAIVASLLKPLLF